MGEAGGHILKGKPGESKDRGNKMRGKQKDTHSGHITNKVVGNNTLQAEQGILRRPSAG